VTEDDRQPSPPPRSRMEDEVREILARADQPASFRDHVRRKTQQQRRNRITQLRHTIIQPAQFGPGTFLILCFAFALGGALARAWSPLTATLLGLASVASLIMVGVRRHGGVSGPEIKTWRGQDLDFNRRADSWADSVRDRFRRPPRG